ncbi:MAG: DNA/RNA nuclease SfsA [Planctomycetota bacterium]|nr:DNA/RNA nuclease SfsA [Planctomycetota bacterium]
MSPPVLLRFEPALTAGILLRRYKRFLADVQLSDGTRVTAHCPDPGSMKTIAEPGRPVALSRSDNRARKLPFTWEMVQIDDTWVGIHTNRSNALIDTALRAEVIPELVSWQTIEREVGVGASRLDFRLSGNGEACYVEVKTVTMCDGNTAMFPDSVTTRGQKHLRELVALRAAGHRAVALFCVNRADCSRFTPADAIDPVYGELLREAHDAGVEVLAYRTNWTPQQVTLDGSIDTVL